MEENPGRALMVGSPEMYEWSSAAVHLQVAPERVLLMDMGFWEQAGGGETWRRLHGRPTPVEELRLLPRCTWRSVFSGGGGGGGGGDLSLRPRVRVRGEQ